MFETGAITDCLREAWTISGQVLLNWIIQKQPKRNAVLLYRITFSQPLRHSDTFHEVYKEFAKPMGLCSRIRVVEESMFPSTIWKENDFVDNICYFYSFQQRLVHGKMRVRDNLWILIMHLTIDKTFVNDNNVFHCLLCCGAFCLTFILRIFHFENISLGLALVRCHINFNENTHASGSGLPSSRSKQVSLVLELLARRGK